MDTVGFGVNYFFLLELKFHSFGFLRYTHRTNCSKFYTRKCSGFANAPMDSVVNTKALESNRLFTFNEISGIPPKLNVDFLNKISREAVVIFAADVEFRSDTYIVVDKSIV